MPRKLKTTVLSDEVEEMSRKLGLKLIKTSVKENLNTAQVESHQIVQIFSNKLILNSYTMLLWKDEVTMTTCNLRFTLEISLKSSLLMEYLIIWQTKEYKNEFPIAGNHFRTFVFEVTFFVVNTLIWKVIWLFFF